MYMYIHVHTCTHMYTHVHTHSTHVHTCLYVHKRITQTMQFVIANFVFLLLSGGDISYHLEKEGRFTVPRVRLYLAEICLALDYLRDKRIIHRDIKPANMLLDSKGHVHLTDFNVACIHREGKVITSMTGTKPYMGM